MRQGKSRPRLHVESIMSNYISVCDERKPLVGQYVVVRMALGIPPVIAGYCGFDRYMCTRTLKDITEFAREWAPLPS